LLLAIDVGNSNIVLGIYDGQRLLRHWRVSTDKARTSDEYGILFHDLFTLAGIAFTQIKAIIISSVVPPLTGVLETLCRDFFLSPPTWLAPASRPACRSSMTTPVRWEPTGS